MSGAGWVFLTLALMYVVQLAVILRGFHVIGRVNREWDRQAADRRGTVIGRG